MLKLFLWTGVMAIGLLLYHFGYLDTNGKIIWFITTVLNITLVLNMDYKDMSLNFMFTIIIALLYAIAMVI